MPEDIPSAQDIAPVKFDPMLGVIRIAKETGRNLSETPDPVMQLAGNAIMTVANQHEAIHMSMKGMVKVKNFVDQGGLDAIYARSQEVLPEGVKQSVPEPPELR